MARPIRALIPTFAGLCLLALAACGGGGTAVAPATPTAPVLDLGFQSSTVPSRVEFVFTNPLSGAATVTAGEASGPFSLDPADLPSSVDASQTTSLGVLFTPPGSGLATGSLTVVYTSASETAERTYTVQAAGETITWGLSPSTLDFGAIDVDDTADLELTLMNSSSLSPVTLTSASLPSSYVILGSPFPIALPPGNLATVTVRFAPTTVGLKDGNLRFGPSDLGGPIDVPLVAESLGEGQEVVTDFGNVSVGAGNLTPLLSVSVPADAISLFIEARTDGGLISDAIGLDTLTGPGSKVYENSSSTGDYIWTTGWDVFTTQIPNTDQTNLQLVPGGGTYQFRLKRLSGFASTMRVRAIVERRDVGSGTASVLPLNVWLANGISVTAATAATDTRLQAVLTRIDGILSQQNVRLGDIDYYDVASSGYDEVLSESEFFEMLETTSSATEVRLNLFFVETALGNGVVGVSAMIAGPKANGTPCSGVMSVYGGYTTNTIGLIAAHEIGHFLGLYHTVESTGSHDFIDDTLNCPANTADTTCPVEGGGYLMHWKAVGGIDVTDGQGLVVRGHPLVEPGAGGSTKPVILSALRADDLPGLASDWCGTCRACQEHKGR